MWISDNSGGVTRWPTGKTRRYELSDSKIGTISVNPTRTHFLLTASNSRFIKYVRYKQGFMCCSLSLLGIWDARKLRLHLTWSGRLAVGELTHSTLNFDAGVVNQYVESTKRKGAFRAEFLHSKPPSSAYRDPRGRQIVSTSYNDRLQCTLNFFSKLLFLMAFIQYGIVYVPQKWHFPQLQTFLSN